jgi:hypothetical protein
MLIESSSRKIQSLADLRDAQLVIAAHGDSFAELPPGSPSLKYTVMPPEGEQSVDRHSQARPEPRRGSHPYK